LKQIDDSLTVDDVKNLLAETAVDLGEEGYDVYFGHGLVCAEALVKAIHIEFIPGDINGDGEVNGKDAIYLARHFAGWPGYNLAPAQFLAADVNGDKMVDGRDLIYFARHFAGWLGYEVFGKR
jgi:hypothetical protein